MKTSLIAAASLVVPDQKILINMVSQRVRRLSFGARPLVVVPPGFLAADIALTEIIEGKLTYEKIPQEELVKPKIVKLVRRSAVPRKLAA